MKNKRTIETLSADDTFALGKSLGQNAKPGDIYALNGDLGAGKTVLAKGIATGLCIKEIVNSPSFTILHTYESGKLLLHHFDVYRITALEEMDEIGYEDCFYGNGVSVVEWGNLIEDILPPDTIWISIERDDSKDYDYRKITITNNKHDDR